ncbi:MAG TPA: hypothetical protein VFG14_19165, partial [Chthoniobacteraceae bacterium]|nr:hypothetical protein [Chthoniobacteraceae bacterium]
HLTQKRLEEWRQTPRAAKAGWTQEISAVTKVGVFTVRGPREKVRRAATVLRALDQPEVNSIADLPWLNMDPGTFTKTEMPNLMMRTDFENAPVTDSLLAALKEAGVSAWQLAQALSAHVLELDKAAFVNQGVPFESITRSPGASTYYEATIPCADRPGQPLTLRIERTTQNIGTQSKFDGFAPWLIEEAKTISIEKK